MMGTATKQRQLPIELTGLLSATKDPELCLAKGEGLVHSGEVGEGSAWLRAAPELAIGRQQAFDISCRASALDPGFKSLILAADTHRDAGEWRLAEVAYEKALLIYPEHAGYILQYAHCLKERGKFTAAEIQYRSALTYAVHREAASVHGLSGLDVLHHLRHVAEKRGYFEYESVAHTATPADPGHCHPILEHPTHRDIVLATEFLQNQVPFSADVLDMLRENDTIHTLFLTLIGSPEFVKANARRSELCYKPRSAGASGVGASTEGLIRWAIKLLDGHSISRDEASEFARRVGSPENVFEYVFSVRNSFADHASLIRALSNPGERLDACPAGQRSSGLKRVLDQVLGQLRLPDKHRRVTAYKSRAELVPADENEGFSEQAGSGPLVDPERDRRRNNQEAAVHPSEVKRDSRMLRDFRRQLPLAAEFDGVGQVARVFHFVYGLKDSGDLPYFAYLAMKSALHFNPGWHAILYCRYEPRGEYWERLRNAVQVIRIPDFEFFNNARLHHYAHKADVIRLIAINQVGGVYLDVDTITRRSFEDLRDAQFCMGIQAAGPNSVPGLCNAVMIGQAEADFSTRWLEHYDYFRSKGRDDLWDYHSVKLPMLLAEEAPETIRVLSYRAFFFPLWNSIEKELFNERRHRLGASLADAYCFHLWNGFTAELLSRVNERYIYGSKSLYAEIGRMVEGIEYVDADGLGGHANLEFGEVSPGSNAFARRANLSAL